MVALNELTRRSIQQAIAECDERGRPAFLKRYGYKRARKYLLFHNGKIYDSKAIVGVAYGKQHDCDALTPYDFSGGKIRVVPVLEGLGYSVFESIHPAETLTPGAVYFRKDLRDQFGGQYQRGIWTPANFPAVLIFSGKSGEKFGYRDGWTDDGVFEFTGEGQEGDMEFTSGNKALRDHQKNGKDVLLFEDLGKGKGVRYRGLFDVASWSYVNGKDQAGSTRKLIMFHLIAVRDDQADEIPKYSLGNRSASSKRKPTSSRNAKTLVQMRKAAYLAADASGSVKNASDANRIYRERSSDVRDYVLMRAKGNCEACGNVAPFSRRDGTPYLEAHHTQRLADDGPDSPKFVAAICPTCHRRIHSGEDGASLNAQVAKLVEQLEEELSQG